MKNKIPKHLTKKQELNVLKKVAPKLPKWKLIKYQRYLLEGVKRYTTLKKFRKINNSNKDFENEVAAITKVLLSSSMENTDRDKFQLELGHIINGYLISHKKEKF